jgi:hypothetical protein
LWPTPKFWTNITITLHKVVWFKHLQFECQGTATKARNSILDTHTNYSQYKKETDSELPSFCSSELISSYEVSITQRLTNVQAHFSEKIYDMIWYDMIWCDILFR